MVDPIGLSGFLGVFVWLVEHGESVRKHGSPDPGKFRRAGVLKAYWRSFDRFERQRIREYFRGR
jgi:hypothetical protein